MKETLLTVLENTRLADGIYRLRLAGDTSAITAPGQFVNLKLSGFFPPPPHLRVRLGERGSDPDL
ncbi:MAG: hypothetical protein ACLRX4_08270 [Oscillospiraceae bacterium]